MESQRRTAVPATAHEVWAVLLVGFSAAFAPAAGGQPRILPLPPPEGQLYSEANGLSGNGRVVCGSGWITSDVTAPVVWTGSGWPVNLGVLPGGRGGFVAGLSRDGAVAGGSSESSTGIRAVRWQGVGEPESLGVLGGDEYSFGQAISADGEVIAGASFTGWAGRLFRWTRGGGLENLGVMPGSASTLAADMTPDGSVIVGTAISTFGDSRAFRWTREGGYRDLGLLPDGSGAQATAVCDDGSMVVGVAFRWDDDPWTFPVHAFRWTAATGMQEIGTLPGFAKLVPRAMSADGSLIAGGAGRAGGLDPAQFDGFVWTEPTGVMHVEQYLASLGVDLTGWALGRVTGVSQDGSVLSGFGLFHGQERAWVLTTCSADFNGDGQVDFFDYLDFVAAFAGDSPSADFNGDGQVDFFDYLDFVAAFAEGCG